MHNEHCVMAAVLSNPLQNLIKITSHLCHDNLDPRVSNDFQPQFQLV